MLELLHPMGKGIFMNTLSLFLTLFISIAVLGCAEENTAPERNNPADTSEAASDSQQDDGSEEVGTENNPDEVEDNVDDEVDSEEDEDPCDGRPAAIIQRRDCGPEVWSNCNDDSPSPLERLYLDGSSSFDPAGGTIVMYQFEVTAAPEGSDPSAFDWQGSQSSQASLWLPLAGHYRICLTVHNDSGVQSCQTEQSCLDIHAGTDNSVHIQLTWDHPTSDQDLHLTHASAGGHYCSEALDCYYLNKQPQWFPEFDAGTGPNPRLDVDDADGLGPENTTIEDPLPGIYRVFVGQSQATDKGPIANTLKIYIDGVLRFDHQRTMLEHNSVWAAADIIWAESYVEVVPFLGEAEAGEIGQVGYLNPKACETPTGWVFPGEEQVE